MIIQSIKAIRASRIIIAALIVYAISAYFDLKEISWIYITLFMVMSDQDTLGGLLNKSYMRIFGTFTGAVYSASIIWLFNNNWIINLIALALGTVILSYVYLNTAKAYVAAIGGATLAICLINYGDTLTAGIRVLNILLGIIISVFAFYCYFPRHASTALTEELINVFEQFTELTSIATQNTTMNSANYEELRSTYRKIETTITTGFVTINRLINELKVEQLGDLTQATLYSQILGHIKHIFRSYDSLIYAITTNQVDYDDTISQSFVTVNRLMIIIKDSVQAADHTNITACELIDRIAMPQFDDHGFVQDILQLIFAEAQALFIALRKLTSAMNNSNI